MQDESHQLLGIVKEDARAEMTGFGKEGEVQVDHRACVGL